MLASVDGGMLRVAAETAPPAIPAPRESKAWTNIAGTAITERMLMEGVTCGPLDDRGD